MKYMQKFPAQLIMGNSAELSAAVFQYGGNVLAISYRKVSVD